MRERNRPRARVERDHAGRIVASCGRNLCPASGRIPARLLLCVFGRSCANPNRPNCQTNRPHVSPVKQAHEKQSDQPSWMTNRD